jgi:YgiT-type zinc finger domain-containing protein
MKEGKTNLEFTEDKVKIRVSNIPALVCQGCGESQIKITVAEYIDRLVNQVIDFERSCEERGLRECPHVQEISLAA